jgi:hypothetical protein
MSAADDNATNPPLTSTWAQLYHGDQAVGIPIEVVAATRNVYHLAELVKEKRAVSVQHCDAGDLFVYPHGTSLYALNNDDRIDPGYSVPTDTSSKNPLMVIVPGKCL